MSDIGKLYESAILDHARNPRNAALPGAASHRADRHNPLCGDRVTVAVVVAGPGQGDARVIADIGFRGVGCAISLAAASCMTEAIKGATIAEARNLSEKFAHLVDRGQAALAGPGETIRKEGTPERPDERLLDERLIDERLTGLAPFAAVAEHPMRKRCATLAWETLAAALTQPP